MQKKLIVKLSDHARKVLTENGFNLVVYKGAYGPKAAKPIIWQMVSSNHLRQINSFEWKSGTYYGFTADVISEYSDGTKVSTASYAAMELGQKLEIDEQGNINVVSGGKEGKLSFHTEGNSTTVGIATKDKHDNDDNIAITLLGDGSATLKPREKFLVMFTTQDVEVNEYYTESQSAAATINFEYDPNIDTYEVEYDPETGKWEPSSSTLGASSASNGWFSFIKRAVNIAAEIVNNI